MDKRATTGRKPRCKACTRADDAIYRQRPEAKALALERVRRYQARHPERTKRHQSEFYWRNRERNLAAMKRWRENNPEKFAAAQRRWQQANQARKTELQRQRLARKLAQFVAEVDEQEIILRDLGICGICGEQIMGPFDLDHVIPLAAGGTHEPNNVQLAHPTCNRRKGAKVAA